MNSSPWMRWRTAATLAVLLAAAGGAAGCSAVARGDKAGGRTTVIHLATIDEINDNGQSYGPQEFVKALGQVSGGQLKVEVQTSYGGGSAEAESRLVHAIAAGTVDGGWPSVRAFGDAGIHGLEPVEAPMTISSYAAEKALVSGTVAGEVVSRLDGSGVHGLGLAVGPLRRPMASDAPLLTPADWRHQTVRIYHSPTQAATVKALGAVPVDLGFAQLTDEVTTGRLRAAEGDIAQMALSGGNLRLANVTTNVVLWPKVFVLSVSDSFYAGLSDEQRGWVDQAARLAVKASVDGSYDESDSAAQLCRNGWRFRTAPAGDVAAMRRAVRPVLDAMAADPADNALLGQVQEIAAQYPGPEPLALGAHCTSGVSKETKLGVIPSEVSGLPEGSYRVQISEADLRRSRLSDSGGLTGTWTLLVRNGTYQLSCRPLDEPGTDCGHEVSDDPLEVGDLRGTGQDAYFVYRPDRLSALTGCTLPVSQTVSGACFAGQNYKMTWAADGNRLTFSHYVSDWSDPWGLVKPLTKIS